ncbi:ABC transporter substrate-binding protein [Flavobacterium noncentrifugens]|uniref:Iron complex transport system substrate-binding protein n=1 Tax=Flavobacterium noncentrifugens TaxID=1128970 RepID=A0A1G9CG91_9FLAO|nr:ABC transporter substrate-binding protein [Flavobacterium noncentrifugens]GEP52023.1 ABC transporter substrate-binding protein [Flavobacterium noncentrifugens]SDK50667.1 iron complex transport system substrate-binding protein [Flavobacterium noncentrifugens]
MKHFFLKSILIFLLVLFGGCKKNETVSTDKNQAVANEIYYAKGLSIYKYDGFSVVKVSNPWPKANKDYTYVLQQKGAGIPDSLKQNTIIQVPIKNIIVTSTTHIPSLEMLGIENTLTGFPNLDFVSSDKVRNLIDQKKIREIGVGQQLNTEVIIDIQPDVIVGYGIDNNNPSLDNLQKSGLKVILNGDWNELSPLGKAEWIKFFGALYGLESKANSIFSNIEKDYNATLEIAKKATTKPTVLSGAMFENQWYLPQGESWGSVIIAQAGGNYLWNNTKGSGSLSLPFETVFEKGEHADFWIGPGQFTSLKELSDSNPHYAKFASFRNKNVYSYSTKKGKTGGLIYFELAPNRPDLVLNDMVKILHPELLPQYELYFFEKLK